MIQISKKISKNKNFKNKKNKNFKNKKIKILKITK